MEASSADSAQLATARARARQQHNQIQSKLLQCPPEILKIIALWIRDPLERMRFSHICSFLFSITSSRDWFDLFCFHHPSWSRGCKLEDEPDRDGTSMWKKITVKDSYLFKRLTADLPPLPPPLTSLSLQQSSDADVNADADASANADADASANANIAMDVDSAFEHTIPNSDAVYVIAPSETVASEVTGAASMSEVSNNVQTRVGRLRVLLNEAQVFHSDTTTTNGKWRRIGSPVYNIHYPSDSIISASMLMRPTATGGDCLQDRQILLYQLPDLTNPIAVCGSEYWTGDLDQGNKWYHDLPRDQVTVCQIMDIRHYPEQIINRKMRVVMIVAFGENSQRHPQDTAEESYVLDIWRLLKVIEIWIPAFPRRPNSDSNGAFMDKESNPWFRQTEQETPARVPSIPRKGRVETIFPSRNDNVLRGRIAKLFTAPPTGGSSSSLPSSSPSSSSSTAIATTTAATSSGGSRESQEMLDCIAIFGIQDSDTSAAMVIKKVLFLEDKAKSIASWSKKQISRGVSCMTLFPYHSNYERMLVLFNRYGRGLIWDWVNEKQVAQLHMPVDHRPKSFQDRPKDSSDSNASSANTADTADATNANINANANANANASASTASIIANTTVAPAPSNEMTSNTSTAPLPTSVGAPVITPAPAPNLNANPNPNSNPNPNVDPAAAAFAQHPDLYYWGVQVSWAVEVPIPPRKDPTQRCSFRIVILADGAENEWESCCWHVDSTVLGTSERDLEAPPFIPPNERKVRYKPSESPENTLYADSKRYERQTIGHCLPEQLEANKAEEGKPIIFIAYVVWNHFRIALTSQMGLTIFDMEELGTKEPDETRPVDRQWVTYLDDTKNNPLVDIATVGDNLVITRRHSHMVWSFYG
ncbi:hypothetical protein BCR41DRAFT_391678 [Lobosporangium transversale]|uniref:F-box domain-containing protein n=1 Tax=Lobosporangium transversale TaxID=64571 RepID=A0A1Y2H0X9_9FUNG|nr:hypothetical protein BCR41DRAFT_391678 [Lobosporangium transversale]ORZ28210.1 hypothetical protein BCR41DRAFT_391678 [Lobosporangium transversale]|eukprot:XP_021885895.1 hypothetical protein BCR41DRAFT_391678 [Lobosporangium transversale]